MSVAGPGDLVSPCADGAQNKTVKKVVDYKLLNGKRYYKVKWECSWEVEDNLLTCQELVDQFWAFVNRVKSEDNNNAIYKKKDNMLLVMHEEESGSNERQDCEQQQSIDNVCFNDDTTGLTLVDVKHMGGGEKICRGESSVCKSPPMTAIDTPNQPHALCIKSGTTGIPQYPSTTFKRSYKIMNTSTKEKFSDESCDIIDLKMPQLEENVVNGEANGERKFQCGVCGMAFKQKDMCKRHSRTHSDDFSYFCSICKRRFIRRYKLVKHLNKDHQTSDETKIISTKRRRDIIKQELHSGPRILFSGNKK